MPRFLALALCIALLASTIRAQGNITLGVILSTDYSFLGNSITLGFAAVNSKGIIPNGITLDYISRNEGDQGTALLAVNELAALCSCQNAAPVAGVIGTAFSFTSTASQFLLAKAKIPQLSPTATDPSLSNKATYPFFMRMAPTDDRQAAVMVSFIQNYGWTKVAFFNTQESYGQGGQEAFLREAAKAGIEVVAVGSVPVSASGQPGDLTPLLKLAEASQTHIIVLFGVGSLARDYVAAANLRGMTGNGYTYLFSESLVSELAGDSLTQDQKDSFYRLASGSFVVTVSGGEGAPYDEFKSAWINAGYSLQDFISFALTTYDTVFVYADALKRMINASADYSNGTLLLQYMLATNITGASGSISFDQNGDPLGNYDISNFQDTTGALTRIAKFSLGALSITANPVWTTADNSVPDDIPPKKKSADHTLRNGLIGMGVGLFAILVIAILIVIFRQQFFLVVVPKHEASGSWD